jgi:hypothetical protein
MKATLKIIPVICDVPPYHTPKEKQLVLSKQFQNEYRIYRVTKSWRPYRFFDLESVKPSEFRAYDKILSAPIDELFQIGCECVDGHTLPLSPDDWEYALEKIGKEIVEIEIKEHKDIEDDVMDGIWNYPICKIIK